MRATRNMVRQRADLRVHEEISVLQKKLSETDIQLTEERKTQVRLTNEANSKVGQLNDVKAAIEEEEQSFQMDVKAILSDTEMVKKENKRRMAELKRKKTDLEHHISAMDTLEAENSYLRKQILDVTREYDETLIAQEEEREKIKQRTFDSRMIMESVLRKEIQTLDTNFKVLAIQSMNDEAMMASNENKGLYAELSRREDLSRSMIAEQQGSYEDLQRITIEHEVMITAADYYENFIKELTGTVKKQEFKEKKLRAETRKVQEIIETYQSVSEEKYIQAKKIIELFKKYQMSKEKNIKGRVECIKRCQNALKLSIKRASEQQKRNSHRLSQDEERAVRKEEQDAISNGFHKKREMLPSQNTASQQTEDLERPEEDYEAMWQNSKVRLPQLSGSMRMAVLRSDNYNDSLKFAKSKKILIPKNVSTSMTNHL